MLQHIVKDEKKVEYLELIYDLIFVYVIGRNNSLLHHVTDGFVGGGLFYAYVLCSLAIIQIWNFSTYYINMHGRNGLRDHVFLFINMYLLYYIAEGTRVHWQESHTQYHAAWALILINIGVQYLLELRNLKACETVYAQTKRMVFVLFGEAAIVLAAIPVFRLTGFELAPAAILFGMLATMLHGKRAQVTLVDFTHLSERAMLYVVFTFGEMIIALAAYFEDSFSAVTFYFSLMSFLIVVGLFLSYGTLYDHLIDREQKSTGLGYMAIHIVLIFAMNNITTALEFMHDGEVHLLPKMLMMIGSLLLYYGAMFSLLHYKKSSCRPTLRFKLTVLGCAAVFAVLMLIFRENMYVNIALTAALTFGVFLLLYRWGQEKNAEFGMRNVE